MKKAALFLIVALIGFVLVFSPSQVVAAEKVKGKVVKIIPQERMVIIKDKSGQQWTFYFEKERVFKRFKRLKIRKGDKVLIRYKRKGGKFIGTYVRSLSGC